MSSEKKPYFEEMQEFVNSFDKMREILDRAHNEGHTARVRTLALTTKQYLELFKNVCDAIKEDTDKQNKA